MRGLATWVSAVAVAVVAAVSAAGAPVAWANAEGPGTPQATAANATFLSSLPAPPGGAAGVCVIDSGVDTDTDLGPALAGRTALLGGVPGDPSDQGATLDTGVTLPKHGTYVAGVIASQVDGVGTSGIWPAAKVYSSRVFAGGANASAADYMRALNWCASAPAVKVINLSLAGLASASISERANLNDKITEVRGAPFNLNVVAAAGNSGSLTTVGYPASASGVFAVGATDASGALAAFNNRGSGLDIATFGVGTCMTTNHGTRLAVGAGTSYAAPMTRCWPRFARTIRRLRRTKRKRSCWMPRKSLAESNCSTPQGHFKAIRRLQPSPTRARRRREQSDCESVRCAVRGERRDGDRGRTSPNIGWRAAATAKADG